MANSNSTNYTSIQLLPEDQHFDGENYVSWKDTMLLTGRVKGLDLYWEGNVNIPSLNTPVPYSTLLSAVNDPSPNPLKYQLQELVAYLTIWNNIKNPSGLGIPLGKTSTELWSYLEREFLLVSHLARQHKEDNLCTYRYVNGVDGKITREGGYAEKIQLLQKAAVDAGAHIPDDQFITIFLDFFPCSPEWNVITGSLMAEKSFSLIVARLQDFYLQQVGKNTQIPAIQKHQHSKPWWTASLNLNRHSLYPMIYGEVESRPILCVLTPTALQKTK